MAHDLDMFLVQETPAHVRQELCALNLSDIQGCPGLASHSTEL
jgi:hypothetical protein